MGEKKSATTLCVRNKSTSDCYRYGKNFSGGTIPPALKRQKMCTKLGGVLRLTLLDKLACTTCGRSPLSYKGEPRSDREDICEGELKCNECGDSFPIHEGIIMFNVSRGETLREMSQWELFAESEGWLDMNEKYLESLPSAGSNVLMKNDTMNWVYHEYNFFRMIKSLNIENKSVLDLGTGRCWSSKWMSLMGGEVVAFDAMAHPTVGLGAGAVFIKNHNIYFERVQGDFSLLPFKNGAFDIVFSSGSVHHSVDISRTVSEISRVVKPGGVVAMANEMASAFYRKTEKCEMTGCQDGINEFAYRMTRLLTLFRKNKLKLANIRESIIVYDKQSPYYQGIFASAINATKWGTLLRLILRGGLVNCVLKKAAD